jgi:hypothetical protein
MTHYPMKSSPRRRLSVLIPLVLVALSVAGCSSSDSGGGDASSAGPSVPMTTGTAATPGATGSPALPTGNGTKAVCARVVKIIQDSSRSAIAALTPALQTGDKAKVAEARAKANAYYHDAADRLRKEATSADSASLRKQIVVAAAYFDNTARTTGMPAADNSLATLSQTCTS